eukprot:Hpha_TRINITY_DN17873_c0_g1::TRINITY_DN17873_c0_g1_i1::g.177456::m.177456
MDAPSADDEVNCSAAALWELLRRNIMAQGTITPQIMQQLNALFQRTLAPALEIIDRAWIQKVVTHNGRELFVVKGKSQGQYQCVRNYCPCQAFDHSCTSGEVLFCKHLLAIALRQVLLPPLEAKVVPDADFANFLYADVCPTTQG